MLPFHTNMPLVRPYMGMTMLRDSYFILHGHLQFKKNSLVAKHSKETEKKRTADSQGVRLSMSHDSHHF